MANPRNESGEKLEEDTKLFLDENNFQYIPHNNQAEIDYRIEIFDDDVQTISGEARKTKIIYADCTNQNVGGSVDEKLPTKIHKYLRKYNYKEVFIIRGLQLPSKATMAFISEMEEWFNIKVHFVTLEEFKSYLLNNVTPLVKSSVMSLFK